MKTTSAKRIFINKLKKVVNKVLHLQLQKKNRNLSDCSLLQYKHIYCNICTYICIYSR